MSERALQSIKDALSKPCVVARIVKAEWLVIALMSLWCGSLLAMSLAGITR